MIRRRLVLALAAIDLVAALAACGGAQGIGNTGGDTGFGASGTGGGAERPCVQAQAVAASCGYTLVPMCPPDCLSACFIDATCTEVDMYFADAGGGLTACAESCPPPSSSGSGSSSSSSGPSSSGASSSGGPGSSGASSSGGSGTSSSGTTNPTCVAYAAKYCGCIGNGSSTCQATIEQQCDTGYAICPSYYDCVLSSTCSAATSCSFCN